MNQFGIAAAITSTHQADTITAIQRERFWWEWNNWKAGASIEELDQLQAALEQFTTQEVVPIVRLMRQVLADEQRRRQLPLSLVTQLEAANWPGAQAFG